MSGPEPERGRAGHRHGRFAGFVYDNGLSLFFFLLLALALLGQVFAGAALYNEQRVAEGGEPVSLLDYVTGSSFAVDVSENWQSEYLQFFLYIFVTVWLLQRGSPESKEPGKAGTESEEEQHIGKHARADSPRWAAARGVRGVLFSRSLGLVMGAIFLLSWLVQSITGLAAHNSDQLGSYQDTVSWTQYVTGAEFWSRTLQNWQSEFLAVGSMAVLAIFLRQRGSPESKPVGASHGDTGVEG